MLSPLPAEIMPVLTVELVGKAIDQQTPRVEVEAVDLLTSGQEWPVRIAARFVISGSNVRSSFELSEHLPSLATKTVQDIAYDLATLIRVNIRERCEASDWKWISSRS